MSIKSKLILIFLIVSLFPMSVAGLLVFNKTRSILQQMVLSEIDQALEIRSGALQDRLNQLIQHVEITSQYPSIQGIIQSQSLSHQHAQQNLNLEKQRLQAFFSSLLKTYPYIFQVRYLNNAGQEVVRVNSKDDVIRIVPADELQNKGERPYFMEAMRMSADQHYISRVELNMEEGRIQVPYVPVIRFAKPIFSKEDGSRQGIIIFNLKVDWLFEDTEGTLLATDFFIINENGDYIFNPSAPDKEFGTILSSGHNYYEEHPGLIVDVNQEDTEWHFNELDGAYRIWQKFHYDPQHMDRYWVFVYRTTKDKLLAPVIQTQRITWGTGVLTSIIVVALAFFMSRTVSTPITRLTQTAEAVAGGNLEVEVQEDLKKSRDEIGKLGQSIDAMKNHLIEANTDLDQKVKQRTLELEQSNEELEQFAYVASHDLQEPIRKIVSYAQLFETRYADQVDADGKMYLEFMVTGAKRMRTLIQNLLEFSKLGKGKWVLQASSMNDIVTEAMQNLELQIQANNAMIRCADLPRIKCNRTSMVQLTQNLLSNSIKYRAKDDPIIEITYQKTANEYEFCFLDNGMGIEPEYLEQIFTIFERLHGSETYDGTGIGLALCKRIVQKHGGRIWAESQTVGTAIKFTLKDVL